MVVTFTDGTTEDLDPKYDDFVITSDELVVFESGRKWSGNFSGLRYPTCNVRQLAMSDEVES